MPFWSKKPAPSDPQGESKVLIIDDDITTLKIVEQALSQAGYVALTATNGEEGIKTAQEHNPKVIIIDVLMPGMDGFMLLKELKNNEQITTTGFIVLTSRDNVGDAFRDLGADCFLTKPVDPQALMTEIKKLV